jgi:Transposase DDE domain
MINWHLYNNALVRRGGEVVLDLDVIDNWNKELKKNMNNGKKGEPYAYPDSFIRLLGYMRTYFHLPYRDRLKARVVRAHTY